MHRSTHDASRVQGVLVQSDKIIFQPVGDELLCYDATTHECWLLSPEASYILKLVQQGEVQIQEAFALKFPKWEAQAQAVVDLALKQLKIRRLLEDSPALANQERRTFLQVAGLTLLTSIVAPLPVAAASARLVVVSAIYDGPALDGGPCGAKAGSGPCIAADFTTQLNARIVAAGGNLLEYETWPGAGALQLPGPDPCTGTKKTFTVTYRCDGVVQSPKVTCDTHTVTSISCP